MIEGSTSQIFWLYFDDTMQLRFLPVTWGFPVSVVVAVRVWSKGDCGGREVMMVCWVTLMEALTTVLAVVAVTGDWTGVVLREVPNLNTGDTWHGIKRNISFNENSHVYPLECQYYGVFCLNSLL
jgi:hypothetical protein